MYGLVNDKYCSLPSKVRNRVASKEGASSLKVSVLELLIGVGAALHSCIFSVASMSLI